LAPRAVAVDGDEAARVLTGIVLTGAEFQVVQVEQNKGALDVYRAMRPDIALLNATAGGDLSRRASYTGAKICSSSHIGANHERTSHRTRQLRAH
jgi:hypothetical protein